MNIAKCTLWMSLKQGMSKAVVPGAAEACGALPKAPNMSFIADGALAAT